MLSEFNMFYCFDASLSTFVAMQIHSRVRDLLLGRIAVGLLRT